MIEVTLLNYLAEKVGAPCYMERPEKPSGEFIVLERTGESRTNFIYSTTIAIQSYADSLYKAALLNEKVKEAMFEGSYLGEVGSVSLNSDYNFTDTALKQYRYQAVFDIVHK